MWNAEMGFHSLCKVWEQLLDGCVWEWIRDALTGSRGVDRDVVDKRCVQKYE